MDAREILGVIGIVLSIGLLALLLSALLVEPLDYPIDDDED